MLADPTERDHAESLGPLASRALKLVTPPRTLPLVVRYAIAASLAALATLFGLWLRPSSYATPFLFLYPAVVLAVWIGGLRPGLLATVLVSVSANRYFLPPYGHFRLDAANLLRTGCFGITFASICWLAEMARAQLREGQRQLSIAQTITSTAADALFMLDGRGRVTFVNPAAEAMFGYKAEELRGAVLHEAVHNKRADGSPYPISQCPLGRVYGKRTTIRRHEDLFFRRDGTPIDVACSHAPVIEGNQVTASVLVVRDITERKQTEQALLRSEKLAATGRLAATIAHEINNPLEAMTNIVYLLGQSVTDASTREYVELLEKQLQAVSRITQQTLKFHRNYGQPAEFKLSELIEELMAFFELKSQEHGVTVVKRLETEAKVVGFSGEIRQVISNLLLNAIEATPQHGRITVHLYAAADWRDGNRRGYRITIADTGTGIDAKHRSRIFEPFFTTKEDKGTGLGLWVSMGIIDRAGGSMRVWSTQRPGRSGTCFSVFLPANLPLGEGPGRRRYEAERPASEDYGHFQPGGVGSP